MRPDSRLPLLLALSMLATGAAPILAQSPSDAGGPTVRLDGTLQPSQVQPGQQARLEVELTLEGDLNGPGLELELPGDWTTRVVSTEDGVSKAGPGTLEVVWLSGSDPGETLTRAVELELTPPEGASTGSFSIHATGSAIDPATGQRETTTAAFTGTLADDENQAPQASMDFPRENPRAGTPIELDGTASVDPDGRLEAHRWRVDGEAVGTGPVLEHAFQEPGTVTVELTVTDDDGRTDTTQRQVEVRGGSLAVDLARSAGGQEPVRPGSSILLAATIEAPGLNGPAVDLQLPDGFSIKPLDDGGAVFRASQHQWLWMDSGTHTARFELVVPQQSPAAVTIEATGSAVDPSDEERVTALDTVELAFETVDPPLGVSIDGPRSATVDEALTFAATPSDPDTALRTVEWRVDGEPAPTSARTLEHAFSREGEHSIHVTVEDSTGRTAEATTTVTANPSPTPDLDVDLSAESTELAPGEGTELTIRLEPGDLGGPGLDLDPDGLDATNLDADQGTFRESEDQWVWLDGGSKTVTARLEVPENARPGEHTLDVIGSAIDGTDERVTTTVTLTVTVETDEGPQPPERGREPQPPDRGKTPPEEQPQPPEQDERPPEARITVPTEDPRTGRPVALDGSASLDPDGSIDTYEWTVDGARAGTGPTIEHTFPTPGPHAVTLTVTDEQGRTDTQQRSLEVALPELPPIPDVRGPALTPRTGEPVLLDATPSRDPNGDIHRFAWDLDADGEIERRGSAVTTTFDDPGPHPVRLTVTDLAGRHATTQTTLSVAPPPAGDVSLTVDPARIDPIQPGEEVEVDADLDTGSAVNPLLAIDAPASVEVSSIADDGATFHQDDREWVWTEPGQRTLTFEVAVPEDTERPRLDLRLDARALAPVSGERLADRATVTVPVARTVEGLGDLAVVAEPTQPEPGDPVTLSLPESFDTDEIEGISWDLGDGARGQGPSVTHRFTQPGTVEPTVIVTGPAGETLSASTELTVRDRTPPTVSLDPETRTLDAGEDLDLSASASDDRRLQSLVVTTVHEGTVDARRSLQPQGTDGDLEMTVGDLPYGKHRLEVTAVDAAGNVDTMQATVFARQVHEVQQRIAAGMQSTVVEQENVARVDTVADTSREATVDVTAIVSEGDKARPERSSEADEASADADEASQGPGESGGEVEVARSLRIEEGSGHDTESIDRVNLTLQFTDRDTRRLVEDEIGVLFWTGDTWRNTRNFVNETIREGNLFVFDAGVIESRQTAYAVVNHTSTFGVGGPSDAVDPQIGRLQPQDTTEDETPEVRAQVTDAQSGIDPEATTMNLDGARVNATLGGDTLAFAPDDDLRQGNHTVRLRAVDQAGNAASETWTFAVDANGGGAGGGGGGPLPESSDGQAGPGPGEGDPADGSPWVQRVELATSTNESINATTAEADPGPVFSPGFAFPDIEWTTSLTGEAATTVEEVGMRVAIPLARAWNQDPSRGVVLDVTNGGDPLETGIHEVDGGTVTYDVRAPTVGTFAFAVDEAEPAVRLAHPDPGKSVTDDSTIRLAWSDNRGLNLSTAEVFVDGDLRTDVAPSPEGVQLSVPDLEPGLHTVQVSIADESDHSVQRSWSFQVEDPSTSDLSTGDQSPAESDAGSEDGSDGQVERWVEEARRTVPGLGIVHALLLVGLLATLVRRRS